MKKGVTMACLLTLISTAFLHAQDFSGPSGSFFIGKTYNITTALQRDLSGNEFLGKGARLNLFTDIFGLSYQYINSRGVVTGVSGFMYDIHSKGLNGRANLITGNGFFNLGFCVINNKTWFGFPYAGIGFSAMKLDITNTLEHDNMIIYKDTISGGSKEVYEASGVAFDFGFSVRWRPSLMPGKKKVIFQLMSLDLGTSVFPSFDYWMNRSTYTTVFSLSSPFVVAPYLRLGMGLGTFHHKTVHKRTAVP